MTYALKGEYSALTAYDVGDIVLGPDNVNYICVKETTAGISFLNGEYFNKLIGTATDLLPILMDLDERVADLEEAAEASSGT